MSTEGDIDRALPQAQSQAEEPAQAHNDSTAPAQAHDSLPSAQTHDHPPVPAQVEAQALDTPSLPAQTHEQPRSVPAVAPAQPQSQDTAAPPTATSAASSQRTINLKVLSPAFEVSEGFNVGAVPVDLTIGGLKQRISELVSTRPPPDRQRLIYHGRLLANDADTLTTVFGSAQIQQQPDFTIHLVLRPPVQSSSASTSTATTSNSNTSTSTPLSQSGTQTPLSQAQSARPTPTPTTNEAAPRRPGQPVGPPPPFPQMPRLMPGIPVIPGMPQIPQLPGMPVFIPPHFPAIPPTQQQQQNGAAAGNAVPGLPQLPAGTTTTRTISGPNGTTYTVRVNHSNFAMHPPGHNQHHHHHHPPNNNNLHHPHMNPFAHLNHQPQHPAMFAQQAQNRQPGVPRATPPPGDIDMNEAFDNPVTASDVRELAELTSQFAQLMQAEAGISESARQAAQTLRTNTDAIATRLRESTARHASAARTSQAPSSARRVSTQPASQAGASVPQQFTTAPALGQSQTHQQQPTAVQQFDATAATVYLLSSPAGPQALLFAPQGNYASQQQQQAYYMNTNPQMAAGFNFMPGTPHPPPTATSNGQGQSIPGNEQQQHHHQQQLPVQDLNANGGLPNPPLNPVQPDPANLQLPAEHEVRDLVRQLNLEGQGGQPIDLLAQWQPLLAQFWLLFRVMLFAYFFFPTDQGWYRPAAMAVISIAFYLLNGEGAGRQVRDAVRGWWEGVIGIPARREEQQQPRQAQQAGAPTQGQPAAPQQQQGQDLPWIRQTLRPLERALALFLASLWPGIGERAGAARREEEERQRRAEQERLAQEEAQRREAAEAESAAIVEGTEVSQPADPAVIPAATVATGADVRDGDALRERKPATLHAATVEEDDEGKEVASAIHTQHSAGQNQIPAEQ